MTLIIDISEELYESYKDRPPMLGDAGMDMIAQSIANGTPLGGVLQEIRQEIADIEICGYTNAHTSFIRTGDNVQTIALKIIDRHIKEIEE